MKQKKSIEQIESEYKSIVDLLIENGGEITEELLEDLNINRNEAAEKITAYYYVMKKLEKEAENAAEEEKRFALRKKIRSNSAQRFKERINLAVSIYGETNLKSKGKIPSIVFETEDLRCTAIPHPVLNQETLPDQEHLEELPEKYLDFVSNLKISPKDAKELVFILNKYNDKHPEAPLIVPEFKPVLNTVLLKNDLLEGVEVSEILIDKNYSVRFS